MVSVHQFRGNGGSLGDYVRGKKPQVRARPKVEYNYGEALVILESQYYWWRCRRGERTDSQGFRAF